MMVRVEKKNHLLIVFTLRKRKDFPVLQVRV